MQERNRAQVTRGHDFGTIGHCMQARKNLDFNDLGSEMVSFRYFLQHVEARKVEMTDCNTLMVWMSCTNLYIPCEPGGTRSDKSDEVQ